MIQSTMDDVLVTPQCIYIYFFKFSFIPFTMVNWKKRKDSGDVRTVVSEFATLAQKGSPMSPQSLWSLQTILLCIVGELVGGGSGAVAVGVLVAVTCNT